MPILGFVLGVLAILYSYLSYAGSPLLRAAPFPLRDRGNLLWLAGWVLIGVGLMLGMGGPLLKMNLRLVRIVLGVAGLALLMLARARRKPDGRERAPHASGTP